MNIERIRQIPVEAVAERLGLEVTKHRCRCPFHEDHHPSMSFRPSKNTWHCFVCDIGGDAIELVKRMKGLDFLDAAAWIGGDEWRREGRMPHPGPRQAGPPKQGGSRCGEALDAGLVEKAGDKRFINRNLFCRALVGAKLLTEEQMRNATERYRLGTTKHGEVVFWQIDREGRLREGKIMAYLPDCHRDKRRSPCSVSSVLKRKGLLPEEWQAERCLFGLHLVEKDNEQPIAIVESEKTAVICSERFPQCLWLATGGLGNLSAEMLLPLKGKRVIIFPDTDPDGTAYRKWKAKADEISIEIGMPLPVSDLLERHATKDEKERKIDLADLEE